ncbi:BTB/POZ domain-containing protein At3g50780-like [Apium graveolens]|uniref:BTB/POZ domain-containing protein At3g50780-like n=1 Tax=Apium graveolens TaxID=4045 RepID=UPI003D79CD68
MAEFRIAKVEKGQTKIRNVPIAVTPEGFWCCPAPVMFQKTHKTPNPLNKPKSSPPTPKNPVQKLEAAEAEKKPSLTPSRSQRGPDDQRKLGSETPVGSASLISVSTPRPKIEMPRKVTIEFGEPGSSDLKVVLHGKQGFTVKLSVHKSVLVEHSSFFGDKFPEHQPDLRCLELDDCDDVEIYVETVGLMYCKDIKQRLIKQSVARVLRILKVAEQLRFNLCMQSCLEYLEAVPWVGEEEEEKVVSSVSRLHGEGIGITPVLKRVSSVISNPPKDTISHVLELVLKSNEEKGRREMKNIVLKLLRENNNLSSSSSSTDICNESIYSSCRSCLDSLLFHFRNAAEPEFSGQPINVKEPVVKQLALEADNLTWLLDILADRQAADEFAIMWANQQELASLHTRLPIVSRHHVSCISARMFVGIGRGELLPSKDTRHMLLQTWLQPLIDDYSWLQHGCRSFDRKAVEEGIGRTILTLPLEDQQSILLTWLGCFLKTGDSCPNLQRAFEVWWRRSFIRPHMEQSNVDQPDNSAT